MFSGMPHPYPPRCAERETMASRLHRQTAGPGTTGTTVRNVVVPLPSRQRGEGAGGALDAARLSGALSA
jgi:hypothetical protein